MFRLLMRFVFFKFRFTARLLRFTITLLGLGLLRFRLLRFRVRLLVFRLLRCRFLRFRYKLRLLGFGADRA